jgi:16S rRNA (guanine966-N2)-methyltransferase
LRITGGKARSRKLITPKTSGKDYIRPTSDRVREALFSILGNVIQNARVLDLFAGTGSFGLDALSRGAEHVVFVDDSSRSIKLIHQNLQNCFDQPKAEIIRLNLEKKASCNTLQNRLSDHDPFNIIFMDPPYEKKMAETTLTMVEKTGLVASEGIVIAEERWKENLSEQIGSLQLKVHRRYGDTAIWIYHHQTG